MHQLFKKNLEQIAGEKAPGPLPTFSVFHMLRAIELIAEKPIGRNQLADNLRIGEGAIRTVVSRLRNAGLITTSKAGCSLTKEGTNLLKAYRSTVKKAQLGKNELTSAECSLAVLIRNRGHELKSGMEQRDAAVMRGARSATTIMFKEGHLIIPSVSNDLSKDFPKAAKQLLERLEPEANDVIVIVSAGSSEEAEMGGLAAAWTLLDDH
jgi:predicted transcriptional regulator